IKALFEKVEVTGDGRLHSNWGQTFGTTGRLSSRSPNLQNVPRKGETFRQINIRDGIVAPPGYVFIAGDYSQLEMIILAHLSKDPQLEGLIQSGQDAFRNNAALLYKKKADKIP